MKWVCVLLFIVGAVYCDTISNLIDFKNLPDLSSLPGADADNIEKLVKDKCKQNGGDNAYKQIIDTVNEVKGYFEKNFKGEEIKKEIEESSKTGSLDDVFKKYCDLKSDVVERSYKVSSAIENCLDNDEKTLLKLAMNITEGLVDFACDKDGVRLALFIVEDGVSCISSKSEKLQKCGTNISTKIPTTFDKIPVLTVTKEECDDFKKVQECVLNVLEECENSTPSNIVDSLLTYIYKLSPCKTLK